MPEIQRGKNTAIIIGHPAHGLRIFRFLELYKPHFYVVTDGSGSGGISRAQNVSDIIRSCCATASPVMCRFTDHQIYRLILEYDTEKLRSLVDEIVEDLDKNNISLIVGDAVEGFSPTHDLCRYIINAVVRIYGAKSLKEVDNYSFPLDGAPSATASVPEERSICINLDDNDFQRKMSAIDKYPGISKDVAHAFDHYGKDAFRTECLTPVTDLDQYVSWDSGLPYYESYGLKKVGEAVYSEVISYNRHMRRLAEYLTEYSDRAIA